MYLCKLVEAWENRWLRIVYGRIRIPDKHTLECKMDTHICNLLKSVKYRIELVSEMRPFSEKMGFWQTYKECFCRDDRSALAWEYGKYNPAVKWQYFSLRLTRMFRELRILFRKELYSSCFNCYLRDTNRGYKLMVWQLERKWPHKDGTRLLRG